jgi:hypothetical protein
MKKLKYDIKTFQKAIQNSKNFTQANLLLDVGYNNTNNNLIKRHAKHYNIDISHLYSHGNSKKLRHSGNYTFTKKQFINAVKKSISMTEILKILHLSEGGSNRKKIIDLSKKFNIDISHIKIREFKVDYKNNLKEILNNKIKADNSYLKKHLIKRGLLKNRCSVCKITKWQDRPAPLQMDHIDGNRYNNNLSNLRILCANCHAQTDTYGGKNKYLYS